MKMHSEDKAARSLEILMAKITEYREDLGKVLCDVETAHDDYELSSYKVYQALLCADRHLELTLRAIEHKMK